MLDPDIVEALLEKGADANVRTADGDTPLHFALSYMESGRELYKAFRFKIVNLLLAAGARVAAVDEDGNTALHLAILHGYIDCARLMLIHDDSSLTIPNKRGEIPLFVSAKGQFSAECPMDMAEFLSRWHILNRPMHRAVANGDVMTIYSALDSGESISARSMLGDAPIHLAAARGNVGMVRFLLSKGAFPGQAGYLGQTALHRAAAACGQPNKTHGLDSPTQKHWTEPEIALFQSVCEYRQHKRDSVPDPSRCYEVAQALLDTGLSPTVPDALLRTPLHLAAATGDEALVQLLLAHGADPNAPDLDLRTPLWYAAASGNIDLMMILNQHGASTRFQPEYFRDVGHLAVQCGRRCVSADMLNKADDQGRTPLIHAVQTGAMASVEHLAQAGAYMGQLGKSWSPLVQACDKRHWGVAKLLLDRGADVREYEHEPKASNAKALHLAARGGSSDMIRDILHAEAKAEEQPDLPKAERTPAHSRRPSMQSIKSVMVPDFLKVERAPARSRRPSVSSFKSVMTTQSGWSAVMKVTSPTAQKIGFYKWTPLHFAASMGHTNAVKTLLGIMERTEIISRDIDGFTAGELAKEAGYEEIFQLIEERLD